MSWTEDSVQRFINKVSQSFNVDFNQLMNLWQKHCLMSGTMDDFNPDDTDKYTKSELQRFCRNRGIKVTGTKEQLGKSLLMHYQDNDDFRGTTTTNGGSTGGGAGGIRGGGERSTKGGAVDNKPPLRGTVPRVYIKKNGQGRWEHDETGFVVRQDPKRVVVVYGKQIGTVVEDLTTEDIEKCKEIGFDYDLPESMIQCDDQDSIHPKDEYDDDMSAEMGLEEEDEFAD